MQTRSSITKSEIDQLRNHGEKIVLIDVRSNAEFQEKHITDALNIPVEEIEAGKFSLEDNEAIIVTACGKGGGRSERAAAYLRENTFKAYFLDGGTFGWFEDQQRSN